MKYLEPIIDAYKANAYAGMETAIFPSYFHGKCQQESLGQSLISVNRGIASTESVSPVGATGRAPATYSET